MTFEGITERPVTLTDGRWEGEPLAPGGASRPSVGLITEIWRTGDLNRDGSEEAAVLLWASGGGSGTFLHLAVVGRRDGKPANLGTAPVGDRVQIRSMEIDSTTVVLEVVQQGPEDAACCPTQKAVRKFALGGGALMETKSEIKGTVSLADLEGVEWVLVGSSPTEPEISFTLAEGSINGTGGCNRFYGVVREGEPGSLDIGQVGATKMACPDPIMTTEGIFFQRLSAVTRYGFLNGRLALTWHAGTESGAMLFEPR